MYFARQATLTITGHTDEVMTRRGRLIARFGGLEIELQDASAHPLSTDVLTIEADLVDGRWRAASVLGLRTFKPTSAHADEGAQPNVGSHGGRTNTIGQAMAAASPFATLAKGGKGPVRAAAASADVSRTAAAGTGRGPTPSRPATAADRGGLNQSTELKVSPLVGQMRMRLEGAGWSRSGSRGDESLSACAHQCDDIADEAQHVADAEQDLRQDTRQQLSGVASIAAPRACAKAMLLSGRGTHQ